MSKALVFAEISNKTIKKGALELLSAVKGQFDEVIVAVCGADSKELAPSFGNYGAQKVFFCEDASLQNYNSESYTSWVADAVEKSGASVILASSSMLARDLFPRVAAKLDCGIATDCVELSIDGGKASAKKPLYSGKCSATVEFSSDKQIVLMRANQLPVADPTSDQAAAEELPLPAMDLKTLVKEVVKGASEKLDLTEANIIVSGGRGLKDADSYNKLLQPLADTLGATLGATRAIVDDGWVAHGMQVGQTGKTVAPTLYIACGISGAIQHLAGMSGSKVIVAINKDPEAPIFNKSTYGIVGDVFEVVPALTEEFKSLLS